MNPFPNSTLWVWSLFTSSESSPRLTPPQSVPNELRIGFSSLSPGTGCGPCLVVDRGCLCSPYPSQDWIASGRSFIGSGWWSVDCGHSLITGDVPKFLGREEVMLLMYLPNSGMVRLNTSPHPFHVSQLYKKYLDLKFNRLMNVLYSSKFYPSLTLLKLTVKIWKVR